VLEHDPDLVDGCDRARVVAAAKDRKPAIQERRFGKT
jgi:hypothetical protein